jgi:hypothetical protein
LQAFRRLRARYEDILAPLVAKARDEYTRTTGVSSTSAIERNLEAHVRVYLINAFLEALNWRFDESAYGAEPRILPEAVIQSFLTGRRRYLDYLGFEAETLAPLLIVETKAPRATLPRRVVPTDAKPKSIEEQREIVANDIVYGLGGGALIGEWSEWLTTLKDYVNSVFQNAGTAPIRVLLTNGDWVVIFTRPVDTLLNGAQSPGDIVVFTNRVELETHYRVIFQLLEFQHVSGDVPYLSVSRLPFHVPASAVVNVLHGLRLRYIEQNKIYSVSPVITLAPVLFIRTSRGTWITVEGPSQEYEIPHRVAELPAHLDTIRDAATRLLDEVRSRLSLDISPTTLKAHYEDDEAFAKLAGVNIKKVGQEFLIATGNKTHYLLKEPTVPGCPFHLWSECHKQGVPAGSASLMIRSVTPRSFFVDAELHHCAHRYVDEAKNSQITQANVAQCGPRSGSFSQPFCEIAPFETRLCCRVCAFEEVCTAADVFHLPCKRPD